MLPAMVFAGFLLSHSSIVAQGIGINTDNPHSSARLEAASTHSGLLIPRLNVSERDSIPLPANGLMIYNKDDGTLDIYAGDGWYQCQKEQVSTSSGNVSFRGVSINNDGSPAADGAVLDVSSSLRGFLPPRSSDPNSIASPATGLIVYDTVNNGLSYYNGSGWKSIVLGNQSTYTGTGSLPSEGVVFGADTSADPSAVLEIRGSGKGLLIPRMTASERDQLNAVEGLMVYNTTDDELNYWDGSAWYAAKTGFSCGDDVTFAYKGSQVTYGTVQNPSTGECWLDRNLGANQVASSSTDAQAYGDLFQWGRGDDGHQDRNSSTTSTLSNTDDPGHGSFITVLNSPNDWRSPQNDTLWQGVSGTNNPCPDGFRLPTQSELEDERQSWNANNAYGAFASPLKLPMSGYRLFDDASVQSEGGHGPYWSSSTDNTNACYLGFGSNSAAVFCDPRAFGLSVRCIRE